VPQKLIGNQLHKDRIEAFARQTEQLLAETVQMFVQVTKNIMILVRQIERFTVKIVLTKAINRKKEQPGLQLMFPEKVNHKEPISIGGERQPDSHRGLIPTHGGQIRELQTEGEQAEIRFPIHADPTMSIEMTSGLLRIKVTGEVVGSGVAETVRKQ